MSHAIVIGSGFGGLAAAIRLGARGYRVTVLERLDGPGGRGYVYRQDGYTFDAGPTIITAPYLFEDLWRLCGKRREGRPAGVWGAEKSCNLVERFTRGIVNRAAESCDGSIALNAHEQRVPTRDHQPNGRERWRVSRCGLAQPSGTEVTLQMIYRQHGEATRPGPGASHPSANEE